MIKVNTGEPKQDGYTRMVCISDTHAKINFNIPQGDVLIHAGDITRKSNMNEFKDSIEWLGSLPHPIKIITGGNHDGFLDECFGYIENRQKVLGLMKQHGLLYLEHEVYQLPLEFGSFKLFVSPYAPIHLGGAFMLEDMSRIWEDIPAVDILVTHTPPYGYQDQIVRNNSHVGCRYLRDKIQQIKPRVSIFGHIHEGHGYTYGDDGILYINASLNNHRYKPVNTPILFDISPNKQSPSFGSDSHNLGN
ncbi:Metallo-dependent phosphatase-like protein [Sporodiniella umbellata]|nr:Metallo-dependent phosphatase-like protein [Sporodiniella umbellata]